MARQDLTRDAGAPVDVVSLLLALSVTFLVLVLRLPSASDAGSALGWCAALMLAFCAGAAWRTRGAPAADALGAGARALAVTQRVLTALVWAFPVGIYGYATVAWLRVGHWPSYSNPDPKDLGLTLLHDAVAVGLIVSVVGGVLWAGVFPLFTRVATPRGLRRHTWLFVAGVAAMIAIALLDPGGVVEWYAD